MEKPTRVAVEINSSEYRSLDKGFISIVEWTNGDGFIATINSTGLGNRNIDISYDEFRGLKKAVKSLLKEEDQ